MIFFLIFVSFEKKIRTKNYYLELTTIVVDLYQNNESATSLIRQFEVFKFSDLFLVEKLYHERTLLLFSSLR